MKYPARKFNQQSYNNSDQWARNLFLLYLMNNNFYITNAVENYDVDILAKKDEKEYRFELEVKRNYPFTSAEDYKFKTVSFLGRKIRMHKEKPFIYVIICYETKYALCCNSSDIYKEEYMQIRNVDTIHRKGIDKFYNLPLDKVKFFNLNGYEKTNTSKKTQG